MLSFVLITALLLMFLPACLSVLFASSHPLVILWNFGWYALMGYMAALALESPIGFSVCFVFCFAYVMKLITSPSPQRRHGMRFEHTDFWVNRTVRQRSPGFAQKSPGKNSAADDEGVVIDAEFTREDPNP